MEREEFGSLMSSQEVICGDCLPIMRTYKDKQFDLVLCDPPYGIGMDNQKVRTKPNRPNTHGRGGELQYEKAD